MAIERAAILNFVQLPPLKNMATIIAVDFTNRLVQTPPLPGAPQMVQLQVPAILYYGALTNTGSTPSSVNSASQLTTSQVISADLRSLYQYWA